MSLYLKEYNHRKQPLAKFLYNFFTKYNKLYDTVDESEAVTCGVGRSRSLGDITSIIQSYYPGTSREVVKDTLLDFGTSLVGHYCSTIGKRVYSISDEKPYWYPCGEDIEDEYGDPITYRNIRDKHNLCALEYRNAPETEN